MNLRLATKEDIPQLVQMRVRYLTEDHGEISSENMEKLENSLPIYFHKQLNTGIRAFVAEDNKDIISTVLLLVVEKPANPNFLSGKTGTLLSVYTKPQYRKQGIAGKLIEMAIQAAKDMDLAFIELSATEDGYPLYKKVGFIEEKSHYIHMKYRIQKNS